MPKYSKYIISSIFIVLISFSLFFLNVFAAPTPQMHVESLDYIQIYNDSNIDVGGWAVNPSGVKDIVITVGNGSHNVSNTITSAQLTQRPDVQAVFPTYTDSIASGFAYTIDKNTVTRGDNTLTVTVNGKDGTFQNYTKAIRINKLSPMVCIDYAGTHTERNVINGSIYIEGWSLNASGIQTVTALIDGQNVSGVTYTSQPRPDVASVYPNYLEVATSGYSLTVPVDMKNLSTGLHTVSVVSTGKDGEVTVQSTTLVKALPQMHVESLDYTQIYNDSNIEVGGWAVNPSGVNDIVITVSNGSHNISNTITSAQMTQRPDVNAVFPNYTNSIVSGFNYTFDRSLITRGNNIITVSVTGNDGTIQTYTKSVIMNKKPPMVCIDYAGSSDERNAIYGNVVVEGWSLNSTGVQNVTAQLDGNSIVGVTYTQKPRPDVAAVYPLYPSAASSGYSLIIPVDMKTLGAGTHIITVVSTGNDGEVTTQYVTLTKKMPAIHVESLDNVENYNNSNIDVSGWAINPSGVNNIVISISNGLHTVSKTIDKAHLSQRGDVNAVYSSYGSSIDSGFGASFSRDTILRGQNTITITVNGNDGTTQVYYKTVKMIKNDPITWIDTAGVNGYIYGDIDITGWSINDSGIANLTALLDGNNVSGVSFIKHSRPDLSAYFSQYTNTANSGYSLKLPVDMNSLSPGKHTLTLLSTGNDGDISTREVVLEKAPGLIDIQSPGNGYNSVNNSLDISGWAINYTGIAYMSVYVDDNWIQSATPVMGLATQDVYNASEIYKLYSGSANSGFKATISLSGISSGYHNINVFFQGNDGTRTSQHITVYKPPVSYTSYNIYLNDMTNKNIGVPSSVLDPASIQSAKSYGIFQFMSLNWVEGITAAQINAILIDDHNRAVAAGNNKLDVLLNHGDAILAACRNNNINPLYFVAHTILESGHGTSTLASGVDVIAGTYKDVYNRIVTVTSSDTYYNLFGIHAYDGSAVSNGSQYAGSKGWSTVDLAINGAANWISINYVNGQSYTQDTLYKMKWDPFATDKVHNGVLKSDGSSYWVWEYATDSYWPDSIANIINRYSNIFTGIQLTFDIPDYR